MLIAVQNFLVTVTRENSNLESLQLRRSGVENSNLLRGGKGLIKKLKRRDEPRWPSPERVSECNGYGNGS